MRYVTLRYDAEVPTPSVERSNRYTQCPPQLTYIHLSLCPDHATANNGEKQEPERESINAIPDLSALARRRTMYRRCAIRSVQQAMCIPQDFYFVFLKLTFRRTFGSGSSTLSLWCVRLPFLPSNSLRSDSDADAYANPHLPQYSIQVRIPFSSLFHDSLILLKSHPTAPWSSLALRCNPPISVMKRRNEIGGGSS